MFHVNSDCAFLFFCILFFSPVFGFVWWCFLSHFGSIIVFFRHVSFQDEKNKLHNSLIATNRYTAIEFMSVPSDWWRQIVIERRTPWQTPTPLMQWRSNAKSEHKFDTQLDRPTCKREHHRRWRRRRRQIVRIKSSHAIRRALARPTDRCKSAEKFPCTTNSPPPPLSHSFT